MPPASISMRIARSKREAVLMVWLSWRELGPPMLTSVLSNPPICDGIVAFYPREFEPRLRL
jgi:hypothetical protein